MDNRKLIQNLNKTKLLIEECLSMLGATIKGHKIQITAPVKSQQIHAPELDFSMQPRPFIKQFAKGLSGPKKFTLLLACLAKGDTNKYVKLTVLEKTWGRLTAKSLLGMKFNRFYPNQAKENDWVETKKQGEYNLRPSWKAIFK